MLYTGVGDGGTTKLFDSPKGKRLSKADFVFEVLGTLDELNSSLGYAKALSSKGDVHTSYVEIIENFQQSLFCIQAEVAGSGVSLKEKHVLFLEKVIREIEVVLPPIKSFVISGGGEVGAYLDVVRTIARRVERALVSLRDSKGRQVSDETLKYSNRLSSALYAMARFANYQEGYSENRPEY